MSRRKKINPEQLYAFFLVLRHNKSKGAYTNTTKAFRYTMNIGIQSIDKSWCEHLLDTSKLPTMGEVWTAYKAAQCDQNAQKRQKIRISQRIEELETMKRHIDMQLENLKSAEIPKFMQSTPIPFD